MNNEIENLVLLAYRAGWNEAEYWMRLVGKEAARSIIDDEFAAWVKKSTSGLDTTTVPAGALERMRQSDARPSPQLEAAIERARQRRSKS